MRTADFYHTLLRNAPGDAPQALLRAAADAALAGGTPGDPQDHSRMLLRDLAMRRDAPPDVLTRLATHPDDWVRKQALTNPSLPADVRHARVRSEQAVDVLTGLAETSDDPKVLDILAGKRLRSQKTRRVLVRLLLGNPALPRELGPQLLLQVEQLIGDGDGDEDERDDLAQTVHDTFYNWPELATDAVTVLTNPDLLLAAARFGDLGVSGWRTVETKLVDDALRTHLSGPLPQGPLERLVTLVELDAAPATLRARVAQALLDRAPATSAVLNRARRVLAHVTATDDSDAAALSARAASGDPETLAQLLATPGLPTEVAWQIACDPTTPFEVATDAARRCRGQVADVTPLFAARPDPEEQGRLCWILGPEVTTQLPGDQTPVLAQLLALVADDLRQNSRSYGDHTLRTWGAFIAALETETLMALPWPVVRSLAGVDSVAGWLTTQLVDLLTADGAARMFAEVQEGFTGTAGDLLTGLRSAATA